MGKVIGGVTQGRRLRTMCAAKGTAYIVTYDPGQAMPDHAHERASLTLVLDGEFFDRVGNETRRNRPLTVIVKPAGTVHATRAGHRGAKSLVFDLDDDLAGRLAGGGSNGCVWRRTPPSALELLTLLPALLRDEAGSTAGHVLETVLRRETRWRAQAVAARWIGRATALLHRGAAVRDVAETLGMHRVYLGRRFRRDVGVTPREWRTSSMVAEAARELFLGGRPICEIALDAGFADQAHLCRVFKRRTGLSPRTYRQWVMTPA